MNSFKKILLAIPVLLIGVNAFAQTPPKDPNYDPKAKAILDEVSKTAKAYTTITATFSITVKKTDGKTDVKNGSVMMKGGKYKIVLENKIADKVKKEEYYNDGKTTYVYNEKDNEVTIDCVSAKATDDNSISPNDIFTIHEKGFKYKFIKEETQKDGKVVQLIELVPEKPEKKNYHKVKLVIDKAKKQIISVQFLNKDQTSTMYTIKIFTPNLEVPDSTFQFDKKTHPGAEVIDLRENGECK